MCLLYAHYSKLKTQMLTRQLSDSDQRKYRHEIETLEKSKIQLRYVHVYACNKGASVNLFVLQ